MQKHPDRPEIKDRPEKDRADKIGSRLLLFLKILVPILIIATGLIITGRLYGTKPKARRVRPAPRPPLVSVINATAGKHQIILSAMGTVKPARKIDLKSRLSGEVDKIAEAFTPGGLFKKGEMILTIDPEDFLLAVRRQKSLLKRARADLELETGRQDVAREGLMLMQKTWGRTVTDTDLALRKPQLAQARADLAFARTALDQALLDLSRTEIRSPFNAMVLEQEVEPGSLVTAQVITARLVGTDAYWIEAAVPVDRLRWIILPSQSTPTGSTPKGSRATVRTRDGAEFAGEVIRLLGDINPLSRMARLLIRVTDPLGLLQGTPRTRLIIGSYVNLFIEGTTLTDIIPLPLTAKRDGERVWLLTEGKLAIKEVTIAWQDKRFVYVKEGLSPGDRVIVSGLSAPVEGMAVRTAEEERVKPPDKRSGKEPDMRSDRGARP